VNLRLVALEDVRESRQAREELLSNLPSIQRRSGGVLAAENIAIWRSAALV
jgi:hypothetical protein